MIPVEHILAKVTSLRQECAAKALGAPDRERPEFAYGEVVGRDAAFAMVLEAISEMIEELANRELKREED